jgi:hypothetical protein
MSCSPTVPSSANQNGGKPSCDGGKIGKPRGRDTGPNNQLIALDRQSGTAGQRQGAGSVVDGDLPKNIRHGAQTSIGTSTWCSASYSMRRTTN